MKMKKVALAFTMTFAISLSTFAGCGQVKKADSEATKEVDKSVYMDPTQDIDTRIKALMDQMTLEEKAGQMVQPEQAALEPGDVKKYGIGAVLSGGGSAPKGGNEIINWAERVNELKQEAAETRLGIPLIYGVDSVHGNSNVFGTTVFPHNIAMGAAADPELMKEYGRVVAEETRATGIQWIYAPTLANPQNELWGRSYEGFSENADDIGPLAAAFIEGAQGDYKGSNSDYLSDDRVVCCAKHFIGEGYTEGGRNQGDVVMDEKEFDEKLHSSLIKPYKAAVEAGVPTVMASYNSVNGLKCHENGYLLTDVLKGELGFEGYVSGDYNGAQQVSGNSYRQQVANTINAGVDLLMEPNSWKENISDIVKCVEDGTISEERLDDAVSRILRVKFQAGLFDYGIDTDTEKALREKVGCEENREVAAKAVRESLVLLKNDSYKEETVMEALDDFTSIAVVGSKANDIGAQCGGWTISWQGQTGNITDGTSIIAGFAKESADTGAKFYYSTSGADIDPSAQAVVAVVGESPYAETAGDRSDTTLTIDNGDKSVLDKTFETLENSGMDIPVIIVLLTGRPVTIADYVDRADAIVEAWYPGTEGQGVGQVMFGDYDFNGTLTYTWPWYASDIEEKFTDESKVLFKYGTGLKRDGSSIKSIGTTAIGPKPDKPKANEGAMSGYVDLSSCNYTVEGENYTADSYLITTGNANNISYAQNFGGQWANGKWDVFVPEEGEYTLHFMVAAAEDTNTVEIYYNTPTITDDGNANRTLVPIKATKSMDDYGDVTLDVRLNAGNYEFKLMNNTEDGADIRLDSIIFEQK